MRLGDMRAFLSTTAMLLLASTAMAQEPAQAVPGGPPSPPKREKPAPPPNLGGLVSEIRWPARTRGSLLLVAPERLDIPPDALAGARSREGLALTTLAPLIGHKIEHYGNLSVLAPLSMPVLGVAPEFLRMVQSGRRFGTPNALLASLNQAQWGVVASESGLGRENLLDDRQRSLWDSMLPPVALFSTGMPQARSRMPQKLSPQQVSALRLRISRRLYVNTPGGSWLTDEPEFGGERPGYINAILDQEFMDEAREPSLRRDPTTANEVAYQRKKTDLDPARLETTIALSGVKTVGELVARIAKASNIELYVDRRLAVLPVVVITEPDQGIRAGNALSALIRATTGAIRAVSVGNERAYVLTHDRVPLAVIGTEISDALFPIFVQQATSARFGNGTRLPDVWNSIPRRERTPSPESMWQKGEQLEPEPFPVAELPEAFQQRARKIRENLPDEPVPAGKRDTATVQAQVNLELVAPYWGGATAQMGVLPIKAFRRPADLPLASVPQTPKLRGLQVALPHTPAERTRLLTLASERGFTTLLLPLSGDTRDDALFTAFVQEAQAKKITLVPTLCPLQPAPNDTTLERDLSLTGRAATEMNAGRTLGLLTEVMPPLASLFRRITERDFITPEAAPVSAFARRVATLASVPGVTDVVLAELVAPGYNERQTGDFEFIWTGGATPAARLAMLRRDGVDPMDIGNGIMGRIAPPLFEGSEPDALLRKFRGERRDAYLKRLDTALKATGHRARLWAAPLLEGGNLSSREQYVSLWLGKLPSTKATTNALRIHDHTTAQMQGAEQQMNGQPGDEEPNMTRRWLRELFTQDKTQSFILDFSDMSLTDSLKLIEASIAKKAP